MPTRLRLTARSLAAACAAVTAACGGDKITGLARAVGLDLGTSRSTVSGALSREVRGIAVYGDLGAHAGGAAFNLVLGSLAADSTLAEAVVLTRTRAELPAAGTYAVAGSSDAEPPADAFSLGAAFRDASGTTYVCSATGGSVKVTALAGGRLQGSYTATAQCADERNPQQAAAATLTGSFDAVDGAKYVHVPSAARATLRSGAWAVRAR